MLGEQSDVLRPCCHSKVRVHSPSSVCLSYSLTLNSSSALFPVIPFHSHFLRSLTHTKGEWRLEILRMNWERRVVEGKTGRKCGIRRQYLKVPVTRYVND